MDFQKHLTVEKLTLLLSLSGLVVTLILSEINKKANIDLEEKRLESTLFLNSIEINNKKATLDNITFLLKMGVLSKERELAIQKLTDSIYSDRQNQHYPSSDSVGYIVFRIYNTKNPDVSLYDKWVRGACMQIDSKDSINPLHIIAYSDFEGILDISYPALYSGSFVSIKITKKGFKTKEYQTRLPDYGTSIGVHNEVVIDKDN